MRVLVLGLQCCDLVVKGYNETVLQGILEQAVARCLVYFHLLYLVCEGLLGILQFFVLLVNVLLHKCLIVFSIRKLFIKILSLSSSGFLISIRNYLRFSSLVSNFLGIVPLLSPPVFYSLNCLLHLVLVFLLLRVQVLLRIIKGVIGSLLRCIGLLRLLISFSRLGSNFSQGVIGLLVLLESLVKGLLGGLEVRVLGDGV